MSTLAHVFEAEGIASVALGSIRKQMESSAPPRGLWCDFPLGRPLGKPGDPEFQHRVLDVAFSLLNATEPILVEFDESIPDRGDTVLTCPHSLRVTTPTPTRPSTRLVACSPPTSAASR